MARSEGGGEESADTGAYVPQPVFHPRYRHLQPDPSPSPEPEPAVELVADEGSAAHGLAARPAPSRPDRRRATIALVLVAGVLAVSAPLLRPSSTEQAAERMDADAPAAHDATRSPHGADPTSLDPGSRHVDPGRSSGAPAGSTPDTVRSAAVSPGSPAGGFGRPGPEAVPRPSATATLDEGGRLADTTSTLAGAATTQAGPPATTAGGGRGPTATTVRPVATTTRPVATVAPPPTTRPAPPTTVPTTIARSCSTRLARGRIVPQDSVFVFDGQSNSLAPDRQRAYPQKVMDRRFPGQIHGIPAAGGTDFLQRIDYAPARTDVFVGWQRRTRDVLFIEGGQTDLLRGASGATVYDRLRSYNDGRRAAGFDLVIGATMPPSTLFDAQENAQRLDYNARLRGDCLGAGLDVLVDIASIPQLSNPADTRWYSDGVHVTDEATDLMVDAYLWSLP